MNFTKEKLHNFISNRLLVISVIVCVILFFSQLLGNVVWQLELFSHYVLHATILLWCSVFVFPKKRSRLLRCFLFCIALSLTAWCFSPLSIFKNLFLSENPIGLNNSSRIVYQNVKIDNQDPHHTVTQLLQYLPDIIILSEAGGVHWHTALIEIHDQYPVYCGDTQASPFAMQVFIKDKDSRCEVLNIAGFPVIKITEADSKVIYGIHPPPPINTHLVEAQRNFFSEFKKILNSKQKIMVVGDMNISGFSPTYRMFMANSGLRTMTLHVLPTWLPFGLGLDHVFTNTTKLVEVQPLGWNGSDHRGLLIRW